MAEQRFRTRGIEQAIADRVEDAGPTGIPMGVLVEAVIADGATESEAEQAIWSLMQQRRLTPSGYVRRVLRRREGGEPREQRTYEFMLVAWTPDMDRQLDMSFDAAAEGSDSDPAG